MIFTNELKRCPACEGDHFKNSVYNSHERYLSEPHLSYAQCLDCNTAFLNPVPTDSELAAFYASKQTEEAVDEIVKQSAARVLEPKRKDYFYDNRVKPLLKYLPEKGKVFDVGCGVGAFIYAMKQAGFETAGCDLSHVSIRAGKEVLELNEKNIFYGDVYSIPENKYDLITLWTVIEHLLAPEEYLKFLKENRLSKNGYVLVEFPTTDSLMFEYLGEYFKWVMPPYHINLFSKKGMEKILNRAGFEVVETHSMPLNWYFFESAAKKVGLTDDQIAAVQKIAPGLSLEIDKIFDDISFKQNKSSSFWMLAKSI